MIIILLASDSARRQEMSARSVTELSELTSEVNCNAPPPLGSALSRQACVADCVVKGRMQQIVGRMH